ncbi:TonB-dependent receptor [Niabella insulamsoli]|uniref:TonB-dependent receptor n=1 Tax=Niabella insulamsoli TaxID=3144874 RepID=UPI0031FC9E1D
MNRSSWRGMLLWMLLYGGIAEAQTGDVKGRITDKWDQPLVFASVRILNSDKAAVSDSLGNYVISDLEYGSWIMEATATGFKTARSKFNLQKEESRLDILLGEVDQELEEVVISGTMKEVSRNDSPVPIEVYTSKFFKANPTATIFDALQNINGVRPQLNCNICNTGDIHINGLEGPYTMILIDGMPIVSGLSTVYGLSGIPQSLVDRIEVVKGPASTLYGSEAVGGLINVITKRPGNVPLLAADVFATSWKELNVDLSAKLRAGKKATSLLGVNYFNYQHPIDNNQDHFTDVTLQHRVSVFNKWDVERPENRIFSLAGRYVYEDRWGGEMNWSARYRGGDEVYGESIYTSRWELFGTYQLPLKETLLLQFSANGHDQNSVYGNIPYQANQKISFAQLTWFKTIQKHELLTGLAYRYTYYDDNTPATADLNNVGWNKPARTHLPGLFMQDEIALHANHKLLLGLRYDYNSLHGNIVTPRINYKWSSFDRKHTLRLSLGNGYRVANVFTEDHAALTGAREVVFTEDLKPETSWNANLNFVKKINVGAAFLGLDATLFYTYFTNKVIPDYDSDPNKIIYDNLKGYGVSRGVSLNADLVLPNGFKALIGATAMDVFNKENGMRQRQLFAERLTGVWTLGYTIPGVGVKIDYTGNLYGPMRLPLLSDLDPRSAYAPWWSIQNIQLSRNIGEKIEIYGGVKNLLNWTPAKGSPFLIARANDPFDKEVQFDAEGRAIATPDNPYGLTFDPSYVYAPNQGIRGFLGFRYQLF